MPKTELTAKSRIPTIKACHREAVKSGNDFLRYAVECGDELRAAKAECPHGEWERFIELCGLSKWQAHRYVRASEITTPLMGSNVARAQLLDQQGGSLRMLLDGPPSENGKPKKPKKQAEKEPDLPKGLAEPVVEAVKAGKLQAEPEQLAALADGYEEDSQEELVEAVIAGRTTLEKAIDTGEIPEVPIEDRIKGQARIIESFCKSVKSEWESMMQLAGPWVTDWETRSDGAWRQIENGMKTLRTCKPVEACPNCDGEGCYECFDSGMVTRAWLEQRQ